MHSPLYLLSRFSLTSMLAATALLASACSDIPEFGGPSAGLGGSHSSSDGPRNDLDQVKPVEPGGGSGGTTAECIDVKVDFTPVTPNVVLLVDQSGSMTGGGAFGTKVTEEIAAGTYTPWGCPRDSDDPLDHANQRNPTWRWNVVRNVLLHPTEGVVRPLEDHVRFGLSLYSSERGSSAGGTCPMLTTVDVDFGSHEEMLESFACSDLRRDTPTRESLTATAESLAALGLDGESVIVLATDGAPDNCECYDWNTTIDASCNAAGSLAEKAAVVDEAARIRDDLGIVTHVIDVSDPSNLDLHAHLSDVAEAGGGSVYDGTDPSGLADAFQTIIDGVRSCAIELDGAIETGKASAGSVLLNGEPLVLDGADGWRVNNPSEIELVGEACETIKSGSQQLDITFPCGTFRPPEIR